jgi:hypothetical protein
MKTLIDFDGNKYKTVKIGKQIWTTENFRCTHFNDGEEIPLVIDEETWSHLSIPAYCFYDNTINADTINKYGALYNWYAVNTGKLAPAGWHVPTDVEWTELERKFSKDKFSALPGGYRHYDGTFSYLGDHGSWWSSTEHGASNAYNRHLHYSNEDLSRNYFRKKFGFSVRLVRD